MKKPALKPLIFIALLVVLFAILLTGLIAYLNSARQQQVESAITDEDLQVISAGMTFTDKGQESFLYQSPLFNFQMEINTVKYNFSEKYNGLNIFPANLNNNVYISLTAEKPFDKTTTLAKEVVNFTTYLQSFDSDSVLANETFTVDNTPAQKIVFTRKSFSAKLQNGIIVIFLKNDRLYQLEYDAYTDTALSGKELDSFINSFKFIDSSKISAISKYYSSFWGYGFDYDAKYWQIDTSSASSVFLNKRNLDLADTERATVTVSSLLVSRQDLLGQESTYLDQAVAGKIASLQSNSANRGFKITSQSEVQLAQKRAILLEYTTDAASSFDSGFHKLYLVLHYNNLTTIALDYNSQEGGAPGELAKIIAGFQIAEPTSGNVKGVSTESSTEEKVALVAKPAVARIFNLTSANLTIPLSANLPSSSGKTYKLTVAAYGSGFFVNSKGYVATNGHVTVLDDFDIASYGFNVDLVLNIFKDFYLPKLIQLDPAYANLTNSQIIELLKQSPDILNEIMQGIAGLIYDKTLTLSNKKTDIYVQKGITPFIYDSKKEKLSNAASHYKASLVDFDYNPQMGYKSFAKEPSSDVALLKLDASGDFPALTLNKDLKSVNVGASILVIGFPGVATDFSLLDKSSQGEETITRGVVSGIKETTGGRTLIQTDASIYHGNSGGPGLDTNANVIGIATLSPGETSGAADFNFLRSVADLQSLMAKNKVTNESGAAEQAWDSGVTSFFDGYFSKAVTSLQRAKKLNPDLVEADNLIAVAQDKISQGLDKKDDTGALTSVESLSSTEKTLFIVVVSLLCFILTAGVIIILKLFSNKNKNSQPPVPLQNMQQQPVQAGSYVPPAMPVQQAAAVQPQTPETYPVPGNTAVAVPAENSQPAVNPVPAANPVPATPGNPEVPQPRIRSPFSPPVSQM